VSIRRCKGIKYEQPHNPTHKGGSEVMPNMKQILQITKRQTKAFYERAEQHERRMRKALKKAKILNGGKEIRAPLNYGKEE